jgi:hypothetical protein
MKKTNRELSIGDFVKEKSFKLQKRVGEILTILSDNKSDPTFECMQVHPKTLKPIEKMIGKIKSFKIRRSKCKPYTPRNQLLEKKDFCIGCFVSYKLNANIKYGRIICYLNKEEGLYPHSYDAGKYNGKDLLECVEINPNNLSRILDSKGNSKVFIANSAKCKLINALVKNDKGETIIPTRLDI